MDNLLLALSGVGGTAGDIVMTRVYLADNDDFQVMNTIYDKYLASPYPARTTITATLRPGVLFEVEAQAIISPR